MELSIEETVDLIFELIGLFILPVVVTLLINSEMIIRFAERLV